MVIEQHMGHYLTLVVSYACWVLIATNIIWGAIHVMWLSSWTQLLLSQLYQDGPKYDPYLLHGGLSCASSLQPLSIV